MVRSTPTIDGQQSNETFAPTLGIDQRGSSGRLVNGNNMTQHRSRRDNPPVDGYTYVDTNPNPNVLPDILNSHLPPPYSTLPPPSIRRLPPPTHPPPPPPILHGPLVHAPPGSLAGSYPHLPMGRSVRGGRGGFGPFPPRGRNRSLIIGTTCTAPAASEGDEPKHCCGVMVTQTVSIRWFIVMIAFVGLCCAIVGTVLGALKATGREHLTVSLLIIGVGIVLITVSGIAWKLTSHDAPSCRAMLGLQSDNPEPNRRFVPRVTPYGRPHHPYGAMMYPEFQQRPPPPSYQASMQEYRLRLLLLDRQQVAAPSLISPPPTYRSNPSSTLQRHPLSVVERDHSGPPSYRSRASSGMALRTSSDTRESRRSGATHENSVARADASHSRNPSLTPSFLSQESLFVDSNHSRPTELIQHAQFRAPSGDNRNYETGATCGEHNVRKNPDINRVTILQTIDSSQVLTQDTVVVSVNGQSVGSPVSSSSVNQGEVQILAHV
ncbi:uncharacterized protein LOC106471793 [Limulus polyphemus]|uniref:Uncharacterized protein LOC106471793 n=1 Tax=Limulus polyphemus TaxID=6850 RepID=A0ABM1BSL5_LIMPO|nr:uncharacterized protein LOC106471793 [Limulus polyphemus]